MAAPARPQRPVRRRRVPMSLRRTPAAGMAAPSAAAGFRVFRETCRCVRSRFVPQPCYDGLSPPGGGSTACCRVAAVQPSCAVRDGIRVSVSRDGESQGRKCPWWQRQCRFMQIDQRRVLSRGLAVPPVERRAAVSEPPGDAAPPMPRYRRPARERTAGGPDARIAWNSEERPVLCGPAKIAGFGRGRRRSETSACGAADHGGPIRPPRAIRFAAASSTAPDTPGHPAGKRP